jgi:hypothetical protein
MDRHRAAADSLCHREAVAEPSGRLFQRRHVYEHEAGVATRSYLAESGDISVKEGALIRETRENARRLAGCAVRIATNLDAGFSDPVV